MSTLDTTHVGLVPSGHVIEAGPLTVALRRAANRLYGIDESCARFPAAMPQSVDDTNAAQMHRVPYVAMEKTDGVHFILLMTRVAGKPVAVMFGRSGVMFRVNMPAATPFYKGTLLEGELVRWVHARKRPARDDDGGDSTHSDAHRAMRFVVFEAVALAGVNLRKLTFVDRLNAARYMAEPTGGADLSLDALRARAAAGKLTLAHQDMWLDAKRPRAVKDTLDLVQTNTQPCDGVVFVPNVPFWECGRKWAVLKKKFSDTLDFVVRVEKKPDTSIALSILFTCGDDSLNMFTDLTYAGRDVQIILKTSSRAFKRYLARVRSSLAVETCSEEVCEFRVTNPTPLPDAPARWAPHSRDTTVVRDFGYVVHAQFLKPRPDKQHPNTLNTITRTFLGMSATLEDVVRRAVMSE